MRARRTTCGVALSLLTTLAAADPVPAPQVRNGSFETDAYSQSPGYARQNGGQIAEWHASGAAGVNPVWKDPAKRIGPDGPFLDNGRVPEGRQVAFIQGPGVLRQTLTGLRQGQRYRVLYRENARVQRRGPQWPQVRVTLGGTVIVSVHEVTPVATADQMETPFYRVESAWFSPGGDGPCDLVIETVQTSGTTTLLVDDVRIEAAPGP